MADHSIRVVTLLTTDEYIEMQAMADADGLSDSAFIRRLIKQEVRIRALTAPAPAQSLSLVADE